MVGMAAANHTSSLLQLSAGPDFQNTHRLTLTASCQPSQSSSDIRNLILSFENVCERKNQSKSLSSKTLLAYLRECPRACTSLGGTGNGSQWPKFRVAAMQRGHYGTEVAARDRVMEFGKFTGTKMGMISSTYLKWMVKNLSAGSNSEWAEYAEEVLEDPYYKDRLEWEQVEKQMIVAHDGDPVTGNKDVFAPARLYGWDLEDDTGWRRVNFGKIGTTEGGRIPRTKNSAQPIAPSPGDLLKRRALSSKEAISTKLLRKEMVQLSSLQSEVDNSPESTQDGLTRRRAERRERRRAGR